jgi:hypothetical protein
LKPILALVDFRKILIPKGQTVHVRFDVRELKKNMRIYELNPDHQVWAVGKSSRELTSKLTVK